MNDRVYEGPDRSAVTDIADARELSRQSMCVLESLHFNNFENALNAMEDFLYGFELCDHTLHFGTIASLLAGVVEHFTEIDLRQDGSVDYDELLNYNSHHPSLRDGLEWILCHYEALAKASLLHRAVLTKDGLLRVQRVFEGLDCIQKNVKSDRITAADLASLKEQPGVSELIAYMESHGKHGKDASISAEELAEISAETLWLSPNT
jgi:hypothetical protein